MLFKDMLYSTTTKKKKSYLALIVPYLSHTLRIGFGAGHTKFIFKNPSSTLFRCGSMI